MLPGWLKFELDEILEKFFLLLKGTVSSKFLKAFWALNKRPNWNGIKKFKNAQFQKCSFSSRGPPSPMHWTMKNHLNVQVRTGNKLAWRKVEWYFLNHRTIFLINKFCAHLPLEKVLLYKHGSFFGPKLKKIVFLQN